MNISRTTLLPLALTLAGLAIPAPAQDMIGVTFAGQVLRIESVTGQTTLLASGQLGKNSLAFTGGNKLWTTVRTGTTLQNFQHFLTQINPFTGAETIGTVNIGDIRGMTGDGTRTGLWAIREAPGSDQLVHIDTATSAVTLIGSTGFGGIQGLDRSDRLRGWDLTAGLIEIDPTTGLATDPFPGVGGPTGLQFLTSNPATGTTFAGRGALHIVNVIDGTTSIGPAILGNPDLRGVEFTTQRIQEFGTPCAGAGGPITISAGLGTGGQSLSVRSFNHEPGALGVQILGFSETTHAGQPLPFSLDSMLGTTGCSVYSSIDLTIIGMVAPSGFLSYSIVLPPGFPFAQFLAQHAAFEAVPGGMSWSAGLRIRKPL